MKKFIASLMIASVIGGSTYSQKSEAGIALLATSGALCISTKCATHPMGFLYWAGIGIPVAALGAAGAITGGILLATANIPAGVVVLVLAEDGSAPQDQLESMLSEKYPFIADREAISALASRIKLKADCMNVDTEGKKIVSLTEIEVRLALAATEISEVEMNQVVVDLK